MNLQNDQNRIAQIAVFFAQKSGGKIDVRKLTKLFYITNRYSIKEVCHPLYYDTFSCNNHGVIMHRTLNRLVNANFYGRLISYNDGTIRPHMDYERDQLDELSDFSFELIQKVWNMHGHQDNEELLYYMTIYPEVKLGQISYFDIFKANGYTDEIAQHCVNEIMFFERLDRQLDGIEV